MVGWVGLRVTKVARGVEEIDLIICEFLGFGVFGNKRRQKTSKGGE